MIKYAIKPEYITDPPSKVQLMYEAVSALVRENVAIDHLKVQDITSRAGIGKGTAYEYFTSKEEIIAHAMMYEYSCKIQELVASVMQVSDFHGRIYRVMDWILDNKEYNQMFTKLVSTLARDGGSATNGKVADVAGGSATNANLSGTVGGSAEGFMDPEGAFPREALGYILKIVGDVMEDGYQEGIFTETNAAKRAMIILTQMSQYGMIVMSPLGQSGVGMTDTELREFVYTTIVKALN